MLRSSSGIVPNYVMLVLGNEGASPHHIRGPSYIGPMDWFKKASGSDFEYSSNIQLKLKTKFTFFYTYVSPKG